MPTACTLIPSNLARLRAALRRYRHDLTPALYFRAGQRLVRIITHGDLVILRQRMTVAGYMKSQRAAA